MLMWMLSMVGVTGVGAGIAALLGGGPWMLMAVKWLWGWLSHATFLQVVCGILAVALAGDHVGLLISHRHSVKVEGQLSKCSAARLADQAAVRAKTALAQAQDAAHKAQVERDQNRVSQESDNDIRQKIAAAVAAARARMQPAPTAHPGSGGSPAVPVAAYPSSRTTDPNQEAIVPATDVTTCATNTVLAEGWQSWWKNVSAVPR